MLDNAHVVIYNAIKVVVDNYRPIAYCQLQLVARLCYTVKSMLLNSNSGSTAEPH